MGSRAEVSVHSSYCCQQGCMAQMDNCWTTQPPARPADQDCLHHCISPSFPPGIFKTHWAGCRRKTRTSQSEHISSSTSVGSRR